VSDDTPERVDVLRYPDGSARAVGAGWGEDVVAAHRDEARRQQLTGAVAVAALVTALGAAVGVSVGPLLPLAGAGLLVGLAGAAVRLRRSGPVPEVVDRNLALDRAEERYDLAAVTDDPTGE